MHVQCGPDTQNVRSEKGHFSHAVNVAARQWDPLEEVIESDPLEEVDKKTTPPHHRYQCSDLESDEPPTAAVIRMWLGQNVFALFHSPNPEKYLENNDNSPDLETSAFETHFLI